MQKNIMKNRKNESLLQLLIPKNDESKNVEMQKVYEIYFEEIKRHLKNGEALYIIQKE